MLVCLAMAACVKIVPPRPGVVRSGTMVAVSFAKTWEAVVDVYGDKNLPIRTIDRASGLLVGERLSVEYEPADPTLYDCGTVVEWTSRRTVPAERVAYNVIVRGDSTRSTVKVTPRWMTLTNGENELGGFRDCTSTGAWESAFEALVKERAERK